MTVDVCLNIADFKDETDLYLLKQMKYENDFQI